MPTGKRRFFCERQPSPSKCVWVGRRGSRKRIFVLREARKSTCPATRVGKEGGERKFHSFRRFFKCHRSFENVVDVAKASRFRSGAHGRQRRHGAAGRRQNDRRSSRRQGLRQGLRRLGPISRAEEERGALSRLDQHHGGRKCEIRRRLLRGLARLVQQFSLARLETAATGLLFHVRRSLELLGFFLSYLSVFAVRLTLALWG